MRRMGKNAAKSYLRAVRRNMLCDRATSRRLLEGFQQELPAGLSFEALCHNLGEPERIAAELTEQIPFTERHRHRRKRTLLAGVAIGVTLAVIIGLVAALAYYYQRYRYMLENDMAYYIEGEPEIIDSWDFDEEVSTEPQ